MVTIDLNTISKEEFVNQLILSYDLSDFYLPREQKLLSLDFDFDEMISFLKSKKIAPYKLPERLEIWDELPTRGEKISKVELREDIAQKLKADGKI